MNQLPIKPAIKDAMRDIREMSEEAIPKINESTFVQKVLPSLMYRGERDIDLSFWVDIAGSVFMPIQVVDGSRVLFTVPAICKRPGIEKAKSSKDSTFEVIATAKQKSEVIPQLGERYLDNKMSARIYESSVDQSELDLWNQILTRYGYEPLGTPSGDDPNAVKQERLPNAPHDDIFTGQYDEI
jgi:hypothetical protein